MLTIVDLYYNMQTDIIIFTWHDSENNWIIQTCCCLCVCFMFVTQTHICTHTRINIIIQELFLLVYFSWFWGHIQRYSRVTTLWFGVTPSDAQGTMCYWGLKQGLSHVTHALSLLKHLFIELLKTYIPFWWCGSKWWGNFGCGTYRSPTLCIVEITLLVLVLEIPTGSAGKSDLGPCADKSGALLFSSPQDFLEGFLNLEGLSFTWSFLVHITQYGKWSSGLNPRVLLVLPSFILPFCLLFSPVLCFLRVDSFRISCKMFVFPYCILLLPKNI